MNESRYHTYGYENCSDKINEQILKISELISHDVVKIQEFLDEPLSNVFLINLYYAAGLFEDYKKMLDELINKPNTSMTGLVYILKTLPPDNNLSDYKKNKVTEILNKLDMENLVLI